MWINLRNSSPARSAAALARISSPLGADGTLAEPLPVQQIVPPLPRRRREFVVQRDLGGSRGEDLPLGASTAVGGVRRGEWRLDS